MCFFRAADDTGVKIAAGRKTGKESYMMKDLFDLQRFAEDEAAEDTAGAAEGTSTEGSHAEDIPAELEGVSEDVAREVMAEANREDAQDDGADADQDSDNKPDTTAQQKPEPNQKIPYQRFKQQVDKANDLEAQLAAYRQKFGDINSTPPTQQQPQPQQAPPQPQPAPQPQMQFSPAVAEQIQAAIKQRAMQLTGMSEDDVESLEYAEEGDQRIASWNSALKFAESDVYAGIRQAQIQRAQAAQRILQEHEATVAAFNEYTAKQQALPDFDKIQQYAVDEKGYPSKLSQTDKNIVISAYNRVLQNTASPQDVFTVRTYFEQAKADYYASKGARPARTTTTQQKAHPRSEQLSGVAAPDGSVSVEQLKDMLLTKDWKEIPEKYQNLMKGL